jgi:hypothetical protein
VPVINITLMTAITGPDNLASQVLMGAALEAHVLMAGWTDYMITARVLHDIRAAVRTRLGPGLDDRLGALNLECPLRDGKVLAGHAGMQVAVVCTKGVLARRAADLIGIQRLLELAL